MYIYLASVYEVRAKQRLFIWERAIFLIAIEKFERRRRRPHMTDFT